MQIKLNGQARALEEGSTIDGLLEALGMDGRKVAVEINLAIVPRSRYAQTRFCEGDAVEIVRFIGGG